MKIYGYDMYFENVCKRIRLCIFNLFQKGNNDFKILKIFLECSKKLIKWVNLKNNNL